MQNLKPWRAIANSETTLENVLFKAQLWENINQKPVNERQRLIINHMLENGIVSIGKFDVTALKIALKVALGRG